MASQSSSSYAIEIEVSSSLASGRLALQHPPYAPAVDDEGRVELCQQFFEFGVSEIEVTGSFEEVCASLA